MRQGFVDREFRIKLGMDYGFLASSPLDCGFGAVDLVVFWRRIKDFVSRIMDFGFMSFM